MKSINFCLLLYTLCLFNLNAESQDNEQQRIQSCVDAIDAAIAPCFAWWVKVYDPQSGGCFYSLSGKAAAESGDQRFGPDIEATSKLVRVLEWAGMLDDAPAAFKQGIVDYMNKRQDPKSGFFKDPQHKNLSHNSLTRALGMATGSISRCGGSVQHPLPFERLSENKEAAEHFAHLESVEAFKSWLDKLPWEKRVWTVGGRLLAQNGSIRQLPEDKQKALLSIIPEYVAARQKENGFFGSGKGDHWTSQLSGSYKIASFLDKNNFDIPRADAMKDSILTILFEQDYTNSIVLYNTANILNILNRRGANFSIEQKERIVKRWLEQLKRMQHSDGGIVTHIHKAQPKPNGRLCGKNVVEGNTNATGLIHKARYLLIEMLTGNPPPHKHPQGQILLDGLKAAK